ncbi:MAG: AMP-binding protein [Lautropia sp.]
MQINGRNIPWCSLDALLVDKAAQHGDRVYATIDGRQLSYRELELLSRRVARNLLALGIEKGDRVATLMFNCAELVITWFGVARMGGVWTPINAGLAGADLDHTLRDSGARVLVVDAESRPKVDALDAALRTQFATFCVGEPGSGQASFDALLTGDGSGGPLPSVDPGDPSLILYTGGTTGLPKGVVTPALSLILAGIRYAEAFEVRAGECHFTTLPLFHTLAIQTAIMGTLMHDMKVVIDRRFSVRSYWQRVRQTRANIIDPIGAMLTMLCQQPPGDDDRAHDVRVAIGIWNQIPAHVPVAFKARFGIPMIDVYGLTEGGGALLTTNRLDSYVPGSNGRPHGWIEIRIVDERGLPVAPGESGQILVRPLFPHMGMIGYHNAPQKTLESFRDLWLQTGDLGYLDEGGNLFFGGRKAHWIRRRSENISAYEIEAILGAHPAIAEVVVVGVPAEVGEDDIKAFIIPAEGAAPDPAMLVAWCDGRLAPFKVPRYIEFVTEFPRSITKREIERAVLKRMPNDRAWDREQAIGRLSGQSARSG